MVPMPNRARRVGCKKSIPNLKNSLPVKKQQLLSELIEDESQDNTTSCARRLPVSHQKIWKMREKKQQLKPIFQLKEAIQISKTSFSSKTPLRPSCQLKDAIPISKTCFSGNTLARQASQLKKAIRISHTCLSSLTLPRPTSQVEEAITPARPTSQPKETIQILETPLKQSTAETHLSLSGRRWFRSPTRESPVQQCCKAAATNFLTEGSESYVSDT